MYVHTLLQYGDSYPEEELLVQMVALSFASEGNTRMLPNKFTNSYLQRVNISNKE